MTEHKTETDSSGLVYVIGTEEEAMGWIGRESDPVEEAYPIETRAIEHFVEGIEDPNPLYWSDEFGKQTRWGGRIAPWGVIVLCKEHQVWRPEWMGTHEGQITFHCRTPLPGNRLLATDYEIECYKPFYPGDKMFINEKLINIAPKAFSIGKGHHITVENYFRNQRGELCYKDSRTVFRYRQAD
ncbi:MAG: MaoC family dehydratase N-terminal domain-containing protein [Proteobacteria bacterium]|nr:MaoC family dehydratase N-terminal domain-containing protein [Pseudomonadota bacterium]